MIHVCARNSLVHNMYTITWASLQKTVNVCTGIKQEKIQPLCIPYINVSSIYCIHLLFVYCKIKPTIFFIKNNFLFLFLKKIS